MIRNVLVMKSGLVLFSREFANTVQQVRESYPAARLGDEHEDSSTAQDVEHRILPHIRWQEGSCPRRCSRGCYAHLELPAAFKIGR